MKIELNPTPEQWRLFLIALLICAGVTHEQLLFLVGL